MSANEESFVYIILLKAFVNSMYKNAFVNPRAPVHIISGVGVWLCIKY